MVITRESEELAQHSQTSFAGVRQRGEERLDVGDIYERPILFAASGIEEAGQVTNGCQRLLDGAISAGPGARTPSPVAGTQHGLGEGSGCSAHPGRCGVDPFLPASGGEPLALVGGHRQAAFGEERLQRPGQRSHRPAGTAGPLEHALRVVRVLVLEQPSQRGDHPARACRAVMRSQIRDEIVQPVRRFGEPSGQCLPAHERPVRVALPASPAHAVRGVAAQLAAGLADAGRILRWAWPGARATPPSRFAQIAGFSATRTRRLRGGERGPLLAWPACRLTAESNRPAAFATAP